VEFRIGTVSRDFTAIEMISKEAHGSADVLTRKDQGANPRHDFQRTGEVRGVHAESGLAAR
jgi:hypothetical protein